MDAFVCSVQNGDNSGADTQSSVERKIDEINEKLSQMLTKNDRSFIRDIVKSTIDEIKDQILTSVTRRIEILEGEVHDRCVESDKYRKELQEKEEEISTLKEQNRRLEESVDTEKKAREKCVNDLERYGRRNSVRISGIPHDEHKQPSDSVGEIVVRTLNEKTDMCLKADDIDIAHRLGRWARGKDRSVIVKFVRRQTKINLMKRAKHLKSKNIFVNEDLTRQNQQVLASLRLKDPENVKKCWSFEGKLFALFKDNAEPTEIKFQDFDTWLTKPWPKKLGDDESPVDTR